MAKKLIVNIDELILCRDRLKTAADDLKDIQNALHTAIVAMDSLDGWKSTGSSEFLNKYNTSWVAGVNDRYDVMIRMCDHLDTAIREYEPIVEEAEKLNLESADICPNSGKRR